VFASLFRRSNPPRVLRQSALLLAFGPLLTAGCAGMFTRHEDPTTTGLRLYQDKNYAEAAGAFRNAVRNDERDYKAHYYLAVACDADQRYQEAIEAYRTCLGVMKLTYEGQEDSAFRVKVLDGLAMTVAKADTHDHELNAFEQKAKSSNKAEDYFLIAKIYKYRGDADMALENYQHAVLLDNQSFPILKEYGLYLQQAHQNERATAALEQAYRINDKDQQVNAALTNMGIVVGPSLKERNELAQPVIPKGPIPPVDLAKIKADIGLGSKAAAPEPTPLPAPASSLEAPRD
jgi:Tfp pilus assembly protein PilF